MIDAPGRTDPRFPNDKKYIDIAANVIAAKLDELGAGKKILHYVEVHAEEICFLQSQALERGSASANKNSF